MHLFTRVSLSLKMNMFGYDDLNNELMGLVQGAYSLITFPDLPAPKLRRSARRKVIHNSTGQDEHFLRMTGNPGHGNGPSF
jgi:hypothetical protein